MPASPPAGWRPERRRAPIARAVLPQRKSSGVRPIVEAVALAQPHPARDPGPRPGRGRGGCNGCVRRRGRARGHPQRPRGCARVIARRRRPRRDHGAPDQRAPGRRAVAACDAASSPAPGSWPRAPPGHRPPLLAGLLAHVAGTLLPYAALALVRVHTPHAWQGDWDAPDYGVSLVFGAWLALAAVRAPNRATGLATAFFALALARPGLTLTGRRARLCARDRRSLRAHSAQAAGEPATQVSRTSAAVPLKRTAAARWRASTAADLGVLEVERDEIGGSAGDDARRGEAEAARAVLGEAAPERRRRARVAGGHEHVAPPAQPARAPLALAGLLERIQAHVGVGAERHRHAALPQLGGGQEAVAEVGLGRRARAHRRAGLGQQVELARRDVRGVHDGRGRAQHAAALEVLDRPQAELLERLGHLARLLGRRGCAADSPCRRRARAISASHSRGHGAQRVRRVADRHERVARDRGGEPLDPVRGRPRRCGRRSAADPALGPRPAPPRA